MNVGITATRYGMTGDQAVRTSKLLHELFEAVTDEFHFGMCVGGDQQGAELAAWTGYHLVGHPGNVPWKWAGTMPRYDKLVAICPICFESLPTKPKVVSTKVEKPKSKRCEVCGVSTHGLYIPWDLAGKKTVLDIKEPLDRNKDIVDACPVLIAAPSDRVEKKRGSGTWATIRYARDVAHVPIRYVWPDGTTD